MIRFNRLLKNFPVTHYIFENSKGKINGLLLGERSPLPLWTQAKGLRTRVTSYSSQLYPQQETVQDDTEGENKFTKDIIAKVNDQVAKGQCGRLFAVVYLAGHQWLVTPEDLIVVRGTFAPNIGDQIRLEKIMCVGGRDFTLYGRPLLGKDLVSVEATVIDKDLAHCKIFFRFRKRENHRRLNFSRDTLTTLRINTVEMKQKVNEVQEVEGVDGRVF